MIKIKESENIDQLNKYNDAKDIIVFYFKQFSKPLRYNKKCQNETYIDILFSEHYNLN